VFNVEGVTLVDTPNKETIGSVSRLSSVKFKRGSGDNSWTENPGYPSRHKYHFVGLTNHTEWTLRQKTILICLDPISVVPEGEPRHRSTIAVNSLSLIPIKADPIPAPLGGPTKHASRSMFVLAALAPCCTDKTENKKNSPKSGCRMYNIYRPGGNTEILANSPLVGVRAQTEILQLATSCTRR